MLIYIRMYTNAAFSHQDKTGHTGSNENKVGDMQEYLYMITNIITGIVNIGLCPWAPAGIFPGGGQTFGGAP